jgi:hypothetical protein
LNSAILSPKSIHPTIKMTLHLFLVVVALFVSAIAPAVSSSSSFRGANNKSSELEHGRRGLVCFRKLLDPQVLSQHLTTTTAALSVSDYTDEHLAIAIYMTYGEQGIDRICNLDVIVNNQQHKKQDRSLEDEVQLPSSEQEQATTTTTTCTTPPVDAIYPFETMGGTMYRDYVTNRSMDVFLSDDDADDARTSTSSSYTSRMDPTKIIQQAQVALDDSEEAEYKGLLCTARFDALTNVLTIIDFVVFQHEPILDTINGLVCGLGQGLAKATQTRLRTMIADALQHDHLINQAEAQATYQNTVLVTQSMCTGMSQLQTLSEEMESVIQRKKQMEQTSSTTTNNNNNNNTTASPTATTTSPVTHRPTTLPPTTR